MLRRSGNAAEVRIGVKTAGRFEAHAWVERDGVAVQDVPLGYASILS
jgi:Transglutaminase-like superfamily